MSARILVVDDDNTIRRALSTVLGRAGYEVTTADEAATAIKLTDHFEAVIVDYTMATGTGAEVVEYFKQQFGDRVFCLVLSGQNTDLAATRCRNAGADAIMLKPVLPSELRRVLANALGLMHAAA